MRPLQDKFSELESLLLHHRQVLAQNTGVPFVRLVYRPEDEADCTRRRQTLARVLASEGVRVETLSCKRAMFAHYEEAGRMEQLFELEQTDPEWLARNIGQHARSVMVGRILQAVDTLEGDGVIFVVDTAFAYPYLSLSGVLHDVTNRITSPRALVLFYPGEQNVDGELLLLGRRPSGTYRTRDLV